MKTKEKIGILKSIITNIKTQRCNIFIMTIGHDGAVVINKNGSNIEYYYKKAYRYKDIKDEKKFIATKIIINASIN